jgi:hypothetical protein
MFKRLLTITGKGKLLLDGKEVAEVEYTISCWSIVSEIVSVSTSEAGAVEEFCCTGSLTVAVDNRTLPVELDGLKLILEDGRACHVTLHSAGSVFNGHYSIGFLNKAELMETMTPAQNGRDRE